MTNLNLIMVRVPNKEVYIVCPEDIDSVYYSKMITSLKKYVVKSIENELKKQTHTLILHSNILKKQNLTRKGLF